MVVLGFKDPSGADAAITELQQAQSEGLISMADWARVIRREDGKVDIRQGTSVTGMAALGGTFWGLLFGLIFLMPLAGAAIGALTGAIAGHFTDVGIDDKFIKGLGSQIQPGTSALFVYVVEATGDKVVDRIKPLGPEVLRTSLSHDTEEKLKQALQTNQA
jgi:uncharacterized membrane protein